MTKVFIPIFVIFIFINCASQGPPTGGPVDKTPPQVIDTYPKKDSTSVKRLDEVVFQFSEDMNDLSSLNNIFISPPMKFETEWNDTEVLHIILKDSLKENQTYVVTLGTHIQDLRKNGLERAYNLAFSTGEELDHGQIEGRVQINEKDKKLSVFAFRAVDSTLVFNRVPDYISQVSETGHFSLKYLKSGKYFVFIVHDKNNNLLIDSETEDVGIPSKSISLTENQLRYFGLRFQTTLIDTTRPNCITLRSISNTNTRLNFSERLADIHKLTKSIVIQDSINGNNIDIKAIAENIDNDQLIDIYTDSLILDTTYKLSVSEFYDISGNAGKDTSFYFTPFTKGKEDSLKIVEWSPADSSKNIDPRDKIYIEFNKPVEAKIIKKSFALFTNENEKVNTEVIPTSPFEYIISPITPFTLDSTYHMELYTSKLRSIWNQTMPDSTHSRVFSILDGSTFGAIRGEVVNAGEDADLVIITVNDIKAKESIFKTTAKQDGSFYLPQIPEGQYHLSYFLDSDSSLDYSHGTLYPFTFSEFFADYQDTITVRKRWEVEGLKLHIPKER